VVEDDEGGWVMVSEADVVLVGPPLEGNAGEHLLPSSVTVTVVVAMLTVAATVVVAHEVTVTVGAGHVEVFPGPVDVPLIVVSLVFVELKVEKSEVEEEVLEPLVDVTELVVDDEVDCGTPHSSKLWPFPTVSRQNQELVV
jgi:hypothetical protein